MQSSSSDALSTLEQQIRALDALRTVSAEQVDAILAHSLFTTPSQTASNSANSSSKQEKARIAYLKGLALLHHPDGSRRATALDSLSSAVKLDPAMFCAWNALGNAHFSITRDREAAIQCFDRVLHAAGYYPSASTTQLQSTVPKDAVQEALRQKARILSDASLAKDAVSLNVRDGESWFVLGTCLLAHLDLTQAMRAYAQAERLGLADGGAELFYNKGVVLMHMEQYDAAMEAFRKANLAPRSEDMIQECVFRVKQMQRAMQRVATTAGNTECTWTTFERGRAVVVEVISSQDATPLTAIVRPQSASAASLAIMALYNVSSDVLRAGSMVEISDSNVSVSVVPVHLHGELAYTSSHITVQHPDSVHINGRRVAPVRPQTAIRRM